MYGKTYCFTEIGTGGKLAVAELSIDENHIEFYNWDIQGINRCAFVSSDNDHRYKVFTNDYTDFGKYKIFNNAVNYKVAYVLQQNCDFKKGFNIEDIKWVFFIIPELIDLTFA